MDGAVVLQSAVLARVGVPHGFTTRRGGVSGGVFESLNFGNPMELAGDRRDPTSHISENFRRACGAIGASGREVVQVYQVHGGDVRVFRAGDASRDLGAGPGGETIDYKADALVTDDFTRVLAVRVADCTPVLLASTDGRIVAAVHAGWRGVAAGVAGAAAAAMRRLGAGEIVAAIGPCISVDAFEVGPEVVSAMRTALGEHAAIREHADPGARGTGKAMVDLKECLRRQLVAGGVREVDVLPGCTFAQREDYFSHRRERGHTGRMAALIGTRC